MKTFCRAAGILVVAVAALAQAPQGPLSLDDCIQLALNAPSSITAARQQAEIARYEVVRAKANFLPQTSLANSFIHNSANAGSISFVALNGVREYSSLATVGVDIDTSGRLRAQLARARADQNAAAANMGLTQRDLRRAVTASYYRVLLARRVVQVTRDSLAEAQAFESRVRLLAQNGEAAQADVIKAQSEVALLEEAMNAAELDARLANHELASFWTADVDTTLQLADRMDEPVPLPEAQTPAATPYLGRMEFRLLEARRQGFAADARRARADLYPQLSLISQYGLDSLRYSLHDRGYASFVQLNVPILDFFKARNAARQFDLQAQQVEVQRQVAERIFSKEYRDALSRVDLIYSRIALAENQVRLSTENLRLSRVRYEGGEGLALDVVSAQSQLTQARANYYSAKANYLNAQVDLEVAAGK